MVLRSKIPNKTTLLVFFCSLFCFGNIGRPFLFADIEGPVPQLAIGGGGIHAKKYSGWLFQAEYKSGRYLWATFRPQITSLITKYSSVFVGAGIGWELHLTKQLLLIPSFCPGIYFKGKGKELGCPLEFRSSIEIAYEMKNRVRFGIQIFHVSNAHLSHKNPGFNAFTLSVGIPL